MTDHQKRTCPQCGAEIAYFSMPWRRVTDRQGGPVCRRMGQCPGCGLWLCPLLVWPSCDGDAGGWSVGTVDEFEVAQVAESHDPHANDDDQHLRSRHSKGHRSH